MVNLNELMAFVSQAVDAGVQSYLRGIEPSSDRINQAEAKRYVKRLGFKPAILKRWTEARLITPIKMGDKQNSPVLYSLSEIKKAVTSAKLNTIINNRI